MRKTILAISGATMLLLGMMTANAADDTLPATTHPAIHPPRRTRPPGASTQPSDGNTKAHHDWFLNVERRVEAMHGKPVDIVFVGDSITDNFVATPTPSWNEVGHDVWEKHYAGRNVLDFGLGADRTEHVLWRLENMELKAMRPKVAVVMIGTNNIMDTPEQIAAGVKAVVEKTREVFGGPKVILISILPNKRAGALMAQANTLIEKIADGKNVIYFDLASQMPVEGDGWKGIGRDKLHLSPEGYEIWASAMEPLLSAMLAQSSPADHALHPVGSSVIDPLALTIQGTFGPAINGLSFQQFPLATLQGWQYVAYYDGDRRVCIARRDLSTPDTTPWQVIRFQDYLFKSDDAHNVITLGICPADGTIHLAFDDHVQPLHYRMSSPGVALHPEKVKWAAELFGPITDTLETKLDHFTYPQFVATPEGNLQLFYRHGSSGAGDRWMIDYDAASGKWKNSRQIDSGKGPYDDALGHSTSRNGYENGYTYGPGGKLHSTWCWREKANHDLCYAWSDDEGHTWKNNAGTLVNTGDGQKLISVDSPGITVVKIDRTHSLMNAETQAVDSKGHIHCVMWHRRDDAAYDSKPWNPLLSAYFHYWRDDQGQWQRSMIPSEVGNRPKMLFDQNDNAYVMFMVNRDPQKWQADIYFLDGELRIYAATPASHWTDWKRVYTDPGHYMNEPLFDPSRLKTDGILSILVQDTANHPRESTPLRLLDFHLTGSP